MGSVDLVMIETNPVTWLINDKEYTFDSHTSHCLANTLASWATNYADYMLKLFREKQDKEQN